MSCLFVEMLHYSCFFVFFLRKESNIFATTALATENIFYANITLREIAISASSARRLFLSSSHAKFYQGLSRRIV